MTLTHLQKLPKNVIDLDKLIVSKCFKKLPKVQKIAQSGHTELDPWSILLPYISSGEIYIYVIHLLLSITFEYAVLLNGYLLSREHFTTLQGEIFTTASYSSLSEIFFSDLLVWLNLSMSNRRTEVGS